MRIKYYDIQVIILCDAHFLFLGWLLWTASMSVIVLLKKFAVLFRSLLAYYTSIHIMWLLICQWAINLNALRLHFIIWINMSQCVGCTAAILSPCSPQFHSLYCISKIWMAILITFWETTKLFLNGAQPCSAVGRYQTAPLPQKKQFLPGLCGSFFLNGHSHFKVWHLIIILYICDKTLFPHL